MPTPGSERSLTTRGEKPGALTGDRVGDLLLKAFGDTLGGAVVDHDEVEVGRDDARAAVAVLRLDHLKPSAHQIAQAIRTGDHALAQIQDLERILNRERLRERLVTAPRIVRGFGVYGQAIEARLGRFELEHDAPAAVDQHAFRACELFVAARQDNVRSASAPHEVDPQARSLTDAQRLTRVQPHDAQVVVVAIDSHGVQRDPALVELSEGTAPISLGGETI